MAHAFNQALECSCAASLGPGHLQRTLGSVGARAPSVLINLNPL
jgi:hypothetical protein